MVEGVDKCRRCGSKELIKNGTNGSGNAKYRCKTCTHNGVIQNKHYSEDFKEQVVRASQERCSSRGLARIFGISHQTALRWIKKSQVS